MLAPLANNAPTRLCVLFMVMVLLLQGCAKRDGQPGNDILYKPTSNISNDSLPGFLLNYSNSHAGLWILDSSTTSQLRNALPPEIFLYGRIAAITCFDADGDNHADFCVSIKNTQHGQATIITNTYLLMNAGQGKHTAIVRELPLNIFEERSCITAADYDADGDIDLFIGTRIRAGQYGYNQKSYILQNDGYGNFSDVTMQVCACLLYTGMVTDAQWLDYDKDGRPDLAITGNNQPLRIFKNTGGQLAEACKITRAENTWQRLAVADVNDDGYPDIIGITLTPYGELQSIASFAGYSQPLNNIAATNRYTSHGQYCLLLNNTQGSFTLVSTQLQPAKEITAFK